MRLVIGGMFFLLAALAYKPIHADTPLRIATPNFGDLHKDETTGKWQGELTKFVTAVTQEIKRDADLLVLPFSRVVEMVKTNQIDFGIFIENKKREAISLPVKRISDTYIVMVSKAMNPVYSLSQLKQKRLGHSKKGSIVPLVQKIEGVALMGFKDPKSMLIALESGRVDAIVTPDIRFLEYLDQTRTSPKIFHVVAPFPKRHYSLHASLTFAENNPDIIDAIKKMKPVPLTNFGIHRLRKMYKLTTID